MPDSWCRSVSVSRNNSIGYVGRSGLFSTEGGVGLSLADAPSALEPARTQGPALQSDCRRWLTAPAERRRRRGPHGAPGRKSQRCGPWCLRPASRPSPVEKAKQKAVGEPSAGAGQEARRATPYPNGRFGARFQMFGAQRGRGGARASPRSRATLRRNPEMRRQSLGSAVTIQSDCRAGPATGSAGRQKVRAGSSADGASASDGPTPPSVENNPERPT